MSSTTATGCGWSPGSTDEAAYWLNNTLTQTLEEDEMIAIADSMAEVAPPKREEEAKK